MTAILLTYVRFQYVALQFDALRNLSSMPLIRQALQDLPVGLDDTYDRILLSIDPNYQLQVANTLKWLALSEKVFRIEELAHIFVIHPEPPALKWPEQLFNPRDALKYLSCLVHTWNVSEIRLPPDRIFDWGNHAESEARTTVMRLRLAHFSIKEYLVSHRITQGPAACFGFREGDAHLHIARCCLAYHLQRDASGDKVKTDAELEGCGYPSEQRHSRSRQYWLGRYAASNWPVHLEMVPCELWSPDVLDTAARALVARSSALFETLRSRDFFRLQFLVSGSDAMLLQIPLRFTAYFDFIQLTDMLISSDKYLTQDDLDGALKTASDRGCTAVINLLLDKGAHVHAAKADSEPYDTGSQDEDTPRDTMAEAIDDETDGFNLSLDDRYDDNRRASALQRACHWESFNAVKLLLDSGAKVNARGGYFGTALQAACARSDPRVDLVTLLLERGADVNAQGGHYGNALQASCDNDDEGVVIATLLEAGANINAFGGKHGSALQAAALLQPPSTILSLLLRKGADVNQCGGVYGFYGTPLQAAVVTCRRSNTSQPDQVILLLDNGADVNVEGGHYGTALIAACSEPNVSENISVEMALLLLERGASALAHGGYFGSAWHAAAAHIHREWEPVLQRMLDAGADINDSHGRQHSSALEAALAARPVATHRIRFLLERGADVNARGGKYGFPLQAACCEVFDSHTILDQCFIGVKFLLDNCPNIDVNAQGGLHGTALQAAAYWGQTRSIRALLEYGADVNLRGGQYRSALNTAIFRHFWDIIEILLEAGATPDCRLQPEPDEEWLARIREELKDEGRGAVERYHVFWERHKGT